MKLWHLIVAGLLVWWFFLRGKPSIGATPTAAPAATPPAAHKVEAGGA